jgi:hypothetical protein
MLEDKSFDAAHCMSAGVKLMHMPKKAQIMLEEGEAGHTPAERFYALAAYYPLTGSTTSTLKICNRSTLEPASGTWVGLTRHWCKGIVGKGCLLTAVIVCIQDNTTVITFVL